MEKLFVNLKKCVLMSSSVDFLGFIVSTDRVTADPDKVMAIRE